MIGPAPGFRTGSVPPEGLGDLVLQIGAGQTDVAEQVVVHFTQTVTLAGTVLPVENGVRGFHDQAAEALEADVEGRGSAGRSAKAGQRAGLLNANTHLKLSLCESRTEAA